MSGARRYVDTPPKYMLDGPPSAPSSHGGPGSARRLSNPGSTMASQPPSRQSSSHGRSQDPALDRHRRLTDMCRNIDLPGAAFNLDAQYSVPVEYTRRPVKGNTTGREITVQINSFPVLAFPKQTVYQYDVHIGNGAEKRAIISKVWESKARKAKTPPDVIFDNNKLAWSLHSFKEMTTSVDLDAEEGRPAGKQPNVFRVTIKPTGVVDLSAIHQYFQGKVAFGVEVLVAINFLDHVLRETPSKNPAFTAIKRSFFTPHSEHQAVGGGVDAYKGVYSSIRLAQGNRLVINLDVSNTCFWATGSLMAQVMNVLRCRDPQDLVHKVAWVRNKAGTMVESDGFRNLRKLAKLRVKPSYRGCPCPDKEWQIKSFTREDAKTYTIDIKDHATGQMKSQTVYDYFRTKYNVILQNWQLPLVQMTRKGILYPMEVLSLTGHQRYPFKLDEDQTAKMIKFAVTLPDKRMAAIKTGQSWLNWQSDPIMAKFGLKVDSNMLKTRARILPNPEIQFGGTGPSSKINPGTAGRWDLKGKKFFAPNPLPLESWGVGVFNHGRFRLEEAQVGAFIQAFVRQYKAHGGQVRNENPCVFQAPQDAASAVEQAVNRTGNKFNKRPQLLVFCVPDKNSFHYLRIKKSCDCRYGIVSQVMQNAHVAKANPQYISNVLMKVNAKLGGTTSKAVSRVGGSEFKVPTMVIGADVSHASPGSTAPSMAALTVSMDRIAARYAAACETNGSRVEMITEANIYSMLRPLFQHWQETVGGGSLPQHIYYVRDGVSEGQFQHVLQQELPHMKKLLREMNPKWGGKFVVVVASKRHHIRFFPEAGSGDRKGNPLPGTLVEYDVTSPFEWDFYLNSHSAIQGTARPTHYHVLLDEIGLTPNGFQNMLAEHSYQYMRSTTPVSVFPPVMYAHLASNRARAHEAVPASSGPTSGPGHQTAGHHQSGSSGSGAPPSEHAKLIPMYNVTGIRNTMWYI